MLHIADINCKLNTKAYGCLEGFDSRIFSKHLVSFKGMSRNVAQYATVNTTIRERQICAMEEVVTHKSHHPDHTMLAQWCMHGKNILDTRCTVGRRNSPSCLVMASQNLLSLEVSPASPKPRFVKNIISRSKTSHSRWDDRSISFSACLQRGPYGYRACCQVECRASGRQVMLICDP